MKKKFTSRILWVFALATSMSAFVSSCKDYEADDIAEIQNVDAAQQLALVQLQSDVNGLKSDIATKYAELKGLINTLNTDLGKKADTAVVNPQIRDIYSKLGTLQGDLNKLGQKVDTINSGSIAALWNAINTLNNKAFDASACQTIINQILADKGLNNLSTDVSGLEARIKTLEDTTDFYKKYVLGLPDQIVAAKDSAAKAYAFAYRDSVRIDALEGDLTQVTADLAALRAADSALNARIDTVGQAAMAALAKQISDANDSIDALKITVGGLKTSIKSLQDKDQDLQDQIDDLKKIADLINTNYSTTLKKLITGIIIQGTENDVTGYAALPVGIQSNILSAYFGVAANAVAFPDASGLYDASGILTAADLVGVDQFEAGEGDTLINQTPGNAGTLYLTVNPNTSDFSGIRPSLVNSLDEESAIKLGELTKSSKLLKWGITRAADNSFYEVKATLDAKNIKNAEVDINKAEIVAAAKKLIAQKNFTNLTTLATTVYVGLNEKFDREGVKVTYTDDVLGDRGIYSEYGIFATAVKPLSYNFAAGKTYKLSLLDRIYNRLGSVYEMLDTLSVNIAGNVDLGLDDINLGSFDIVVSQEFPITVTIPANSLTAEINIPVEDDLNNVIGTVNGELTFPASATTVYKDTFDVNITKTITFSDIPSFAAFVTKIEGINGKINTMLTDMNTNVNNQIQSMTDPLKNMIEKIAGYLDKVNSRLTINPNAMIQPTMLYVGQDGALHHLNNATFKLAGGEVAPILASSTTAEIIVPAMKRFVKVVSAPSAAALAAANSAENMNEVVDGTVKVFPFAPTEVGTYEIVYSALDYAGQIRTNKYTVNVVE